MDLEYFKDKIADELCGSKEYIINAMELKAMDPAWSKTLANMSEMELEHASNLHKMANDYYNRISKVYTTVPEYMVQMKKEINNNYSTCMTEIKWLHEAYNK